MGIGDLFKAKQNEELRGKVAQMEALLTPEMRDSIHLQERIEAQKQELEELQAQIEKESVKRQKETAAQVETLRKVKAGIEDARRQLVETNETVLMQSFGLYTPRFAFANSSAYKEELDKVRQQEKDCIKSDRAATGSKNWTVDGSLKEGQKMVANMQKLDGGQYAEVTDPCL